MSFLNGLLLSFHSFAHNSLIFPSIFYKTGVNKRIKSGISGGSRIHCFHIEFSDILLFL